MEPQSEQAVQQPPITYQSSGIFKIFLTTIAILILVSIAAGAYFLGAKHGQSEQSRSVQKQQTTAILTTPTSDPTANWEVYTNDVMKFSLKIPHLWFVHKEEKTLSGYSLAISYPVDNPSSQNWISKQRANITIGLSLSKPQNLDEEVQKRINSPLNNLEKGKELKIDNQRAIALTSKDGHYEEVVVYSNNLSYVISLATPNGSDKNQPDYPNVALSEVQPAFDTILSTFKFTQ